MWHSRIFRHLYLLSAVLILASTAILGFALVGRLERHSLEQIEAGLRARTILVREAVKGLAGKELQKQVEVMGTEIDTRITLIAADGTVLADSQEDPFHLDNHGGPPEVISVHAASTGSVGRFSDTLGLPMMYVALRVDDPHNNVAFVRTAVRLNRVETELAWYRRFVWSAAFLMAGITLVLELWPARRISRRLQELTRGAESIASGGYGHKVYAVGNDEIACLGRAFNSMSEHLEEQFTQLAEDRRQLRMILSGMVEGVVALNAEQRILFANDRAAQLLGFQGRSVVGRQLWEVARRTGLKEVVQQALDDPQPMQRELSWNGAATQRVTVHAARMEGPPPRGAVLVLHDTTELRRLERMRQDFVANVSHELKTPLSIIKACIETLLDGAVEDPLHRGPFLQQIADQGDRLHLLILDLLSLARIEAGTELFELQAVTPAPLVAACLERHRTRAETKRQLLETRPPSRDSSSSANKHTGDAAWADPEAVQEILDNLVDNALKYTPEGGKIRVGWYMENGEICLQVEDSGIGIPEQDLPRIFERFYRVDKARSREMGGTGLGLSIVKHLAQAMHGNVSVTSELGKGTTFTVRLPGAPVS
jgi:two-component system phosphate regulon sensor histidine kinase PhoR